MFPYPDAYWNMLYIFLVKNTADLHQLNKCENSFVFMQECHLVWHNVHYKISANTA